MVLKDEEAGITLDSDFECGSSGSIRKTGPGAYEVDPKPEPLPDNVCRALDEITKKAEKALKEKHFVA